MPRRKLIRQAQFPYHAYIRTSNKDWFNIPLYEVWEICFESLLKANQKVPVQIHAFVLMSNHYHMVLSTPDSNIDKFMECFNKDLSQKIKKHNGSINHKFANRYKWTIIDSTKYLYNIYRYLYQNPVRARLCEKCIDYPYSSLRFSQKQFIQLKIEVHIDYFKYREWMDQHNPGELNSTIRKGLSQSTFRLPRDTRAYITKQFKRPN